MSKEQKKDLLQKVQSLLTTLLFAVCLLYFYRILVGLETFSLFTYLPILALSVLAFVGLFHFWKISLPALGILLLFLLLQALTKASWKVPILGLGFWRGVGEGIRSSLTWALNQEAGPATRPGVLLPYLAIFLSFLSVLTNWLLPIPLLNMGFLILPLFFIRDFSSQPLWLLYLMGGLFCVYSSYAFRQDPEKRDQRPPLLFAACLLALVFLLQAILPADLFFNQALSRKINDRLPRVEETEITSFSLAELGFYPQGKLRVGGPVSLSDQPYLYIRAEADSFYLRGAAYDSFDGNRWSLSQAQALQKFTYNEDFFNDFTSDQARTFWFSDPDSRNRAFQLGLLSPTLYHIRTVQPSQIVFHGGKPMSLTRLKGEIPPDMPTDALLKEYKDPSAFYYSTSGMVVSQKTYEDYGMVTLDYVPYVVNLWNPDLQNQLKPRQFPGERRYQKLVESLDPGLAQIIYAENKPFPLLLQELREYINNNYQYALDVEEIPEDRNFIEQFLREKQGYCVYFASLYSVLLRDAGYDCRYAEGFVIPQDNQAMGPVSERTISAQQAHAWCEIYLEGIGWLPIEATPSSHISDLSGLQNPQDRKKDPTDAQMPDSLSIAEESSEESSTSESLEDQESQEASSEDLSEESVSPEESLEESSPEEGENEPPESPTSPLHGKLGWMLGLGGLILFLALVGALEAGRRKRAWKKRLDPEKLIQMDDPRAAMDLLWPHLKRLWGRLDLDRQASDTIGQVLAKVLARLNVSESADGQKKRLEQLTKEAERYLYSKEKMDRASVEDFHQLYRQMSRAYQEETKGLVWFMKEVWSVKGPNW